MYICNKIESSIHKPQKSYLKYTDTLERTTIRRQIARNTASCHVFTHPPPQKRQSNFVINFIIKNRLVLTLFLECSNFCNINFWQNLSVFNVHRIIKIFYFFYCVRTNFYSRNVYGVCVTLLFPLPYCELPADDPTSVLLRTTVEELESIETL